MYRLRSLNPKILTSAVFNEANILAVCRIPAVGAYTASNHFCSTADPSKSDKGTWLHELDYIQQIFFHGHRAGTRFAVPTYTFRSRSPLNHDDVYQALDHVIKKSGVFQTVVRERDGQLWWFKKTDVKPDFKIHKQGPSKVDILQELWDEGLDETNGPLWKTRLLEVAEDDGSATPEIKKDYPYQYNFFSCPHHALIDGISSALFSQPIIDAINAVIEGDEIDDSRLVGDFVTNEEYLQADATFREKLSQDPKQLETLKSQVQRSDRTPFLFKYYPPPAVDRPLTKHTFVVVDPGILRKFLDNCKKNGLTYGTSLQTVTNAAIIEMAQDAGATDDFFDISVNMTIDTRRYLRQRKLPILGLHARQMASLIRMEKNPRDKFWETCKVIHSKNKELLKSGSALQQDLIRQHFLPKVTPEEYFKTSPPIIRDYGFNNVGPLDPIIHGRGKHVQITRIESYGAVHKYTFPFYQQLFTYRGQDINMVSYATDCMSDETANQLLEKIKSIIIQFAD